MKGLFKSLNICMALSAAVLLSACESTQIPPDHFSVLHGHWQGMMQHKNPYRVLHSHEQDIYIYDRVVLQHRNTSGKIIKSIDLAKTYGIKSVAVQDASYFLAVSDSKIYKIRLDGFLISELANLPHQPSNSGRWWLSQSGKLAFFKQNHSSPIRLFTVSNLSEVPYAPMIAGYKKWRDNKQHIWALLKKQNPDGSFGIKAFNQISGQTIDFADYLVSDCGMFHSNRPEIYVSSISDGVQTIIVKYPNDRIEARKSTGELVYQTDQWICKEVQLATLPFQGRKIAYAIQKRNLEGEKGYSYQEMGLLDIVTQQKIKFFKPAFPNRMSNVSLSEHGWVSAEGDPKKKWFFKNWNGTHWLLKGKSYPIDLKLKTQYINSDRLKITGKASWLGKEYDVDGSMVIDNGEFVPQQIKGLESPYLQANLMLSKEGQSDVQMYLLGEANQARYSVSVLSQIYGSLDGQISRP